MCGAEVPATARACPACGADDMTGWNEDHAVYDGLDLPDDEFDYDEYLKKEFGDTGKTRGKPHKKLWTWLGLIGIVLAVLVFSIALISIP